MDDPLQKQIEEVIKANIADYSYGSRREDQTEIIQNSGLFEPVEFISGQVKHTLNTEAFIEGWKSHGTVYRQSPEVFEKIIVDIRRVVEAQHQDTIVVPYTTRIWMARKKR